MKSIALLFFLPLAVASGAGGVGGLQPTPTPAAPAILTKDLFAEYRFDEGSGTKVKNSARIIPANVNLFTNGEAFKAVTGWGTTTGITDNYALDPFGGFRASRWQNSTANAKVSQQFTISSGKVYTMSVYVASNTGSAQAVRMYYNAALGSDLTVPATGWTRLSTTFTSSTGAGSVLAPFAANAANDTIDILVYGAQIEEAPSASVYIPDSGAMTFQLNTSNGHTWNSTGHYLGTGGTSGNYWRGTVAPVNAGSVTLYVVAKWPTANTNSNQFGLFGGVYGNGGSTGDFRLEADPNGIGSPAFRYGTASVNANTVLSRSNWHDGDWHLLVGTYDGSTARLYIDDCLFGWTTSTQAPRVTAMLQIGSQNEASFFGGEVAYASAYNTAHTQAQVLRQHAAIGSLLATTKSITLPGLQKLVLFEGDSIASGNGSATPYATVIAGQIQTGTRFPQVANYSVASATILNNSGNDLTTRATNEDLMLSKATGSTRSKNILVIEIGHNDLGLRSPSTVFTDLKTYCQARRTAGWTVVLVTVPPATGLAFGGGAFNTARNTLNASIRADTSFYDALADLDTNATIGADAAASNATYYGDGVHPTTAGHALMAPIVKAALDTVL